MTANMIGTVIIQIIIGIILIAECYLYFGKRGEAGGVIKSISVPLKYNAVKVVIYAAIFLAWFYARVLWIQGDYIKTDLIYAAVLLGELILAIVLDNLPQQICENGVITHRGYMAWTQIQSVEPCEKPEVVQLKVQEKAGFMQQIFCTEDEKRTIEEYVAEHMNDISDEDETDASVVNGEEENAMNPETEDAVNEESENAVNAETENVESETVQNEEHTDNIETTETVEAVETVQENATNEETVEPEVVEPEAAAESEPENEIETVEEPAHDEISEEEKETDVSVKEEE